MTDEYGRPRDVWQEVHDKACEQCYADGYRDGVWIACYLIGMGAGFAVVAGLVLGWMG